MGIVIAFEGLDGVGKSSLVNRLYEYMDQHPSKYFRWIYKTKEPGSKWSGYGEEIRSLVLSAPDLQPIERELLFYVDASLHKRFLEAQESAIILSDRGKWSHLAYLSAYFNQRRIDFETYQLLLQVMHLCTYPPDLVVYLQGDLELMKERLKGRPKDVIESQGKAFFEHVLMAYEALKAQREAQGLPTLTLNARDPIAKNLESTVSCISELYRPDELRAGKKLSSL